MEYNREEACRCVEITELYIKKKDLNNALKFSIKAHKLYPTTETKCLMKKLQTSFKGSKQQQKKRKSNESDSSYNGDNSSSSSSNSSHSPKVEPVKKKYRSSKSSTTYSYKMIKDINKDESYKCLEKAEKYIEAKEFDLAEKFVLKSKKLFPLPEADLLLKKIQEFNEMNKPKYTDEQANVVKKVRNSENYYKMLDIETTATVPEIKKAFKKLALLIHPDKNSAPDSGEVFVVVSNAVEILCDSTKRLSYDRTLPQTTTSSFDYSNSYSETLYSSPCSSQYDPFANEYFSDEDIYYDNTYYDSYES